MKPYEALEAWLVTGSQELYGHEVLGQVAAHAQRIAAALDGSEVVPVRIVYQPVVTSPETIRAVCLEANAADACIGVIAWMHTFSPAKMWIGGLQALQQAAPAPAHAVQPRPALGRRSTWTS